MTQGIPARDVMVDKNGQITSIWLIFFDQLYALYSDSGANNEESIKQIREIADRALNLAQLTKSDNEAQQKEIDKLYELIIDSTGKFATAADLEATNKRIDQTDYDVQQLQLALDKLKTSLSDAQKDTKDKIADLQDQINSISRSTFVEAPVDGKTYGRKDMDWAEVIAVNLSLPFFLTDGTRQNIPLTSNFELPFFLADGTQQNIAMVTV